MTFKTTEKNGFKKDPLRGLEVNQKEYRKISAVEVAGIAFVLMLISVCVKMCNDDPQVITLDQLNSARR